MSTRKGVLPTTNEEANDSIGTIETKTKREKNYGNNKQ